MKPQDREAGEGEDLVAVAVALEGPWGEVGGGAVGLGDEAGVRPEEVHLVAVDEGVRARPGQAARGDEGEEALLELAAGDLRLGVGQRRERRPERSGPAAGGDVLEHADVEQAEDLRAVTDALEPVGGQDVGQVEQGAHGGGDRQPLALDDVSVAVEVRLRCTRIAPVDALRRRVVTSTRRGAARRSHRNAALRWLSTTAPAPPQESTAAHRRPRDVRRVWPTA